jgi:hypothetical protein
MSSIIDGLININVTIADFEIESTFRVGTHPGFILNSGALTTEVR